MAPSYAEESLDPKRCVPLSLYYSVIGLGIFYTLTSWCAVSAFNTEGEMLAKATANSSHFFIDTMGQFVGSVGAGAMSILIMTSAFACGMAFHNTASRYLYSLARDGVLPQRLSHTHTRYKSPHVASMAQALVAAPTVYARIGRVTED